VAEKSVKLMLLYGQFHDENVFA